MDYATARDRIVDGDMIAVRGTGAFARLIQLVTRSPYSHCAVAVWLDGGLWASEINGGGNHLIPVSQIKDDFDVYRPHGGIDTDTVRAAIFELLRDRKEYAVLELLRIALYYMLGIVVWKMSRGEYVCNEYAAEIYSRAGYSLVLPPIAAPADVCRAMRKTLEVSHADSQQ